MEPFKAAATAQESLANPPQQHTSPCRQDGNCVLCAPYSGVDQLFGPEFKCLQAKGVVI